MGEHTLQTRVTEVQDRDCLARWFPDGLTDRDELIPFGKTELALIGEVLDRVEERESLLVHNPIPSDRLAVGILLAYARIQDSRFPTNGIVGRGQTLLAFPALHEGYVSTIDDIREDSIGLSSRVIEREPVNQLSEIEGNADIYSANNNFEFDVQRPPGDVGLVFVDLRKPEWGELTRRFSEIMALREAVDCPMILYTDEMTTTAETVAEEMPTKEVSNELMTSVGVADLPENPSLTTQFEHLISNHEISVEQINVASAAMRNIIPDLTAMRDDIQESQGMQGVVTMEVGWLYNLLTRLPVKPQYWDQAVESNFYQQGVRELLENLRGKARRMEGHTSDVLINFCQAADALHGRLNTDHPVQTVLFQLITEEADVDTGRTVIVNSDFERKAILQAITLEDRRLADGVSIETVDDVEPSADREYLVIRPLDADSFVYDFPVGTHVAFLQFALWESMVTDRLSDGVGSIGASVSSQIVGETRDDEPARQETATRSPPASEAEYEPVEDANMETVSDTLQEDFESGDRGGGGSGGGSGQARSPDLLITLSNGEAREFSNQARVSVLKESGDIGRKPAKELQVGDTVVLLDTVADDIYDLFIESAHQKDRIRKSESVVERWRTILDEALEGEWTQNEILAALQERGSDITDQSAISNWQTGESIGPRDPEDVRRILDILKPEMKPTTEPTVKAMKHIRKKHREIGRRARRAIEDQMAGSIASEVSTDLPDGVEVDSENVRKATVEAISTLDE